MNAHSDIAKVQRELEAAKLLREQIHSLRKATRTSRATRSKAKSISKASCGS